MQKFATERKKICWITPDYFLCADAFVVPELANEYDIDWILINTFNTKRKSDGLVLDSFKPTEFQLEYRQKDPRIIPQYIRLLKKIRDTKADLIYISFHGLPYFFPLFFLFIDPKKVIYGAHNVSTPKGASNERWMRLYHTYVYKHIKYFQVFSEYQLEVIRKLLPSKMHYYAPLTLKDYGTSTVTPPTEKIRFLFFGYIREYKRLDVLIEAFQKLYGSRIKNIELYIAGNCDNWEHYKSMIIHNKSVTARIEIIPNSDIPDLISSCHYMVLPYQDGAQSGVLTLAYQYNKPVITSDIIAFRQFVKDGSTGFVFKNQSVESLAEVLNKVIEHHHSNYNTLQNNIAAYVNREFSTAGIVKKYKAFLNDITDNISLEKAGNVSINALPVQ